MRSLHTIGWASLLLAPSFLISFACGNGSNDRGIVHLSVEVTGPVPPPCPVRPGESDVVLLILTLEAGGQSVEIGTMRFQASGSGRDDRDVLEVRLYEDTNRDGTVDPGDALLATAPGFPEDDGTLEFSGLAQTVASGSSEIWLLVYDVGWPRPFDDTLCIHLAPEEPIDAAVDGRPAGIGITEVGPERCVRVAGSWTWMTTGDDVSGGHVGSNVASAGDVDGDGHDDVIVTAGRFQGTGKVYLFHGSPFGVATNPAWTSSPAGTAASAGDVNGDGFDDVIVGEATPLGYEGQARLYLGTPLGLDANPAWTSSGDSQVGARFGSAVSSAGDVNRDGLGDVIVGTVGFDTISGDEGKAYVYAGDPGGLGPSPIWTSSGDDQAGALFGSSVAGAGDVDDDGYDDVIVGAFSFDTGSTGAGKAYVYLGGPTGPDSLPVWTSSGDDQAGALFGWSTAGAGDVDDDGYADLLVGTRGYDTGEVAAGRAYLFRGGPSGPSATADWNSSGDDQAWAYFGWSVSSAGDVDGDGFADVVVGAPGFDTTRTDAGRVYVYAGGPGGPSLSPIWVSSGHDQTGAFLGGWVASAGDIHGNGLAQVIAGAEWYDTRTSDAGCAYLFSPCER